VENSDDRKRGESGWGFSSERLAQLAEGGFRPQAAIASGKCVVGPIGVYCSPPASPFAGASALARFAAHASILHWKHVGLTPFGRV
jgi:hypothetical protein